MKISIEEISPDLLAEYAQVPIKVEVKSIYMVELNDNGLGGMILREVPVEPYVKDYDAYGETPVDWSKKFNLTNWGLFLAKAGWRTIGAAAVAFDTTNVFMLEARHDLSVLWDIRVRPEYRGAGIPLFQQAAKWSQKRGCK